MRLPINWANNFLNAKDTAELLDFAKTLKFQPEDIMDDWVSNPYAEAGKITNTIALLLNLGILSEATGGVVHLDRRDVLLSPEKLQMVVIELLLEKNKTVLFEMIPFDNLNYSESSGAYGFYRNHCPLRYSGALNLLAAFGALKQTDDHYVEIESHEVLRLVIAKVEEAQTKTGGITPEALRRLIERKRIVGEKSEAFALKYENSRLDELGITRRALQVSLLDVSKGFDLMSYESANSPTYDRCIEVKTFNTGTFYLSKNELLKAKELSNRYYIYLVATSSGGTVSVEMIKNPAEEILDLVHWGIEPSQYVVTRIS